MRRILATLMALVMLLSVVPVAAVGANEGVKLVSATYTQPLSKVENLVAGYAVLLRKAEICSDQQLEKPIGQADKGEVVLAESRKGYGTENDRVKVTWACKGEVRTGWVAAKDLRLMAKDEVKTYEKAAKKDDQVVKHGVKLLLNIDAYQAKAAEKDTAARAKLPATTITSLKTTSKGLNIKWKAVEGATKYQVFRSTKKASGFKRIATVTTNTYVDESAKRNTGYYYYIKAVNADGAGEQSPTKGRYNDFGPAVKFSRASNGTVTVSWASKKNAVSYALYRANDGESSYKKIATVKSGTSYVDKTAANGKTYSYYVVANYTVNGKSMTGSQGSRKSYTFGVKKPTDIAAANVASGVKISWDAADNATGYRVFYRVNADDAWTQLTTTKATAGSYTHKAPAYGKLIQYSVRTQGKHNGKTVYAGHTIVEHVAVGQVTDVEIFTYADGMMGVGFDGAAAKGATGFEVHVTDPDGVENVYESDGSTEAFFYGTASGVYKAYVVGYCELDGKRWYGRASTTVTTEAEGYDPATIPEMTVAMSSTANLLDISWQPVEGAVGYVVLVEEEGQTQTKECAATATGVTVAVNEGTVKVKMHAVFDRGTGRNCGEQTVQADWTDGVRLEKPTATMTQGEAFNTAHVAWESVAGAAEYRLAVSQNAWAVQEVVTGNEYDLTLNGNATYLLSLRAETVLPNGEWIVGPWYKGSYTLTWPDEVANTPIATVKLSDTPNQIDISWNEIPGAESYTVRVFGENDGWYIEGGTNETSLSMNVNGGETLKVYVWSTVDGKDSNAAEVSIHAEWPDMIAMESPAVTVSLLEEPEVLVSWDAVEGASMYYLLVTTGGVGAGYYEAYGTSRTLTVTPETSYQFNVVPVYDDGAHVTFPGPRSAFVNCWLDWGHLRLNAPVVKADMSVPNVMTFRWDAVPDAVNYLVELTRGGETRAYQTNQLFISDVTNGDGTEYSVAVRALAEDPATGLVVGSDYGTAWAVATWENGVNLVQPQVRVFANSCDEERGLVETLVTWESVPGADGYGLCQGEANGPCVMVDVGDTDAMGFDLVKGKEYFFFVEPYFYVNGEKVTGPLSEVVTFTALYGVDTLTAPVMTLHVDEYFNVHVTWAPVEGAASYTITYGKAGETPAELYVEAWAGEDVDLPVTGCDFPGEIGATYEVSMCANWEEDGCLDHGPASATQTITVEEEEINLVAPAMTLSTADRGWLTVSWEPVEGATRYRIFYKESTESGFSNLYVDGTETSVQLPAVNNKTYKVYMRAINVSAYTGVTTSGPVCATKTASTAWTGRLAAPTLTIEKGAKGELNLSWTKINNAEGYILSYKTADETIYNDIALSADTLSYTLPVTPEVTYNLYVYAFEGDETLPYAGKLSATQTYFATWIPVLVSPAMELSQGTIYCMNITWEPVEFATQYRIFYKKQGASGFTNVLLDASETSYSLQVENDATYEVYMRALNVAEDGTTTSGPKCANQTIYVYWEEPTMVPPVLTVTPVAGDPGITELEIAWTVPNEEWKYFLGYREVGEESFQLREITDWDNPAIWYANTGSVMEFYVKSCCHVEGFNFWSEASESIILTAAYGYYALVEPEMTLSLGAENHIEITLGEQTFADYFVVYVKPQGAAEYTRMEIPAGMESFSYQAEPETIYDFYAAAAILQEDGSLREGPACQVQSIMAYWAPALPQPQVSFENDYNGKVTVAWGDVTGATSLEVWYRKAGEEYTVESIDLVAEPTDALHLLLEPMTDYEFVVVIYHEYLGVVYGFQYSETETLTTLGGPELPAPVMTLSLGDKGYINIAWESVENATGYSLFYKTEDDAGFTNVMVDADVTNYLFAVQNDATYEVYMRAIHVDEVTGVTTSGTKCANQTIKADWTVYRALLIGQIYKNEDYLPGPDVDAKGMKKMLSTMSNTPYRTTVAQDLTANGIRSAIATAFAGATEDSVSLFYYSGHGMNNYGGSYQGALVGTGGTYLSVSDLRTALDQVPGTKIVILDSCHSGAHIGKSVGAMSVVEKADLAGFNNSVIMAFSARQKDLATNSNLATDRYYVLTASHSQETSLSMGIQNYRYVGVFTHALLYGSGYDEWNDELLTKLRADANGDKRISLQEAYTYAYEGVLNGVGSMNPSANQHVQVYPTGSSFVLWEK